MSVLIIIYCILEPSQATKVRSRASPFDLQNLPRLWDIARLLSQEQQVPLTPA